MVKTKFDPNAKKRNYTTRKKKSRNPEEEIAMDLERDRLFDQDQDHEILVAPFDQAEIESYVRRNNQTRSAEDDVDSFSYWYGQT